MPISTVLSNLRMLFMRLGEFIRAAKWPDPRLPMALLLVSVVPVSSEAAQHTWVPKAQIQSGYVVLQPVLITGTSIKWGSGAWDQGFTESASIMQSGASSSLGVAITNAKNTAINLSNICSNPAVSSATKSTTSKSDALDRWLAATDVFNTITARGLFGMYQAAYGSTGISILIDTKRYMGFKVTYSDGASEVWVINPGYSTSSVKLLDSPAPNSLTAPNPKAACTSTG